MDGIGTSDFAALLDAARDGDEAAFRALFRAHQPPLLRYLRALAPDDADDIAAETWVTVVRALAGFSGGEGEFRAWLYTIARSRRADLARNRARRPATATLDGVTVVDPQDVEAAVGEILTTESAVALVATLAPDQAEVVLLRHLVGLDVAQTAHVLDKSRAAVRVLAHRGLRNLAELLAAEPRPDRRTPRRSAERRGVTR